jgi:hypothetical protein
LLPTAIETLEAIKEVIRAVMLESNESFDLKNTTEANIILINETLTFDENPSKITLNDEFNQYNTTLEMLESSTSEITTLGITENQTEAAFNDFSDDNKLEQYTQQTTESFDFLLKIEEEGSKERKGVKKEDKNFFPSTSPQVLFPLFSNPKIEPFISTISVLENDQKGHSIESNLLNQATTYSSSSSENYISSSNFSSSADYLTTQMTFNNNIQNVETSSPSSTLTLKGENSINTIIDDSTTSRSTLTLASSQTSLNSSTTTIDIIATTLDNSTTSSSSTLTSSSSVSRLSPILISSNTITLPKPTPKKYIVSFDEKKFELKPFNGLKTYYNSRSYTKSINFPIFDNEIETATENDIEEEENDKIITTIKKSEKTKEIETEQNMKLKQYNNNHLTSETETTITTPSLTSKTTNTTVIPHLWMKTQKIFTLPWVQTRRLSLAKCKFKKKFFFHF